MPLDRSEVAPLVDALVASSGETRDAIEEALARVEAVDEPGPARGFASSVGMVDPAVVGRRPGSSWFGEPLPWLEEDVAPVAVTHWFAHAVDDADVNAGADIVLWVHVYGERFRPDLAGLFEQYRRAVVPPSWSATKPARDGDTQRILAWQVAWTVSRGGLRALVPGLGGALASADKVKRSAAARLIADAAANVLEAEPPTLGYGYQAAPGGGQVELSGLLSDAARAGIVPAPPRAVTAVAQAKSPAEILEELGLPLPQPAPPRAPADLPDEAAPPPGAARSSSPVGWLVALAIVAGSALAIAKWVFGWLTVPDDAAAPADEVQCTVFAPSVAAPGSAILVQVFAHPPADAADAQAIATELDVAAQRRAYRSLAERVPAGRRLDFELRMPGLEIDDLVASLVWRGRTEAVQFGVTVPASTRAGTVIGTVAISLDGAPVGHVKFTLAIAAAAEEAVPEPQGVEAKRYRIAFVSYASRDRDEVLRRVQMLPLAGLRYFQDVLTLEAGENWSERIEQAIRDADVFLLFWSSRARDSEWVRKEVDFALTLQAGDDLAAPEIRPVIIEGPPMIPPWDDLAHLHFGDRVLYFMSRPTTKD